MGHSPRREQLAQQERRGKGTMRDLEDAAVFFATAIGSKLEEEFGKIRNEIERLREETFRERPSAAPEDRYLNQSQAAKLLGCSTGFIRKQRKAGNFPEPTRLGARDLRWSQTALLAWAESQRPAAATARDASRIDTT